MTWCAAFRWLLAAFFVVAGANHFRDPALYLAMMPPSLPGPAGLVQVSGVAEILGGLGVLVPPTRRFAGWGLIVLLIAIFPANLQLALHPGQVPGLAAPAWVLWARLPLQLGLIGWAWWTAAAKPAENPLA